MNSYCHRLCHFIFLLAMVFVPSCGGGTHGTGGITIEGRLLDLDGIPLFQVMVTESVGGDSDQTDQGGSFTLLSSRQSDITILFKGDELDTSATVTNIPGDAVILRVTFRADRSNNQVEPQDVSVEHAPSSSSSSLSSASNTSSSNSSSSSNQSEVATSSSPSSSSSSMSAGSSSNTSSEDDDDSSSSDDSEDHAESSSQSSSASSTSSSSQGNEEEHIDRRGPITALSSQAVVVGGVTFIPTLTTEYRDEDGQSITLSQFSIGEEVDARGVVRSSGVDLERLRKR